MKTKLYKIVNATHFGPADMTGQDSEVQYSVIVPYSILIWLKKSTAIMKMKKFLKYTALDRAKIGKKVNYRKLME